MKKIIYSLAILALFSQTIVSCDKDDNGTETVNPNPNPNPNPDPNPGTQSRIEITVDSENYFTGDVATFTATLNGQDVTSTATFYIDDTAIQGNTFTSNTEGSFLVHASYPNAQNSTYAQISYTVNPFVEINGTGNITFNGQTKNIQKALLWQYGYYWTDETQTSVVCLWSLISFDEEHPDTANTYLDLEFYTPCTHSGQNITSVSPITNSSPTDFRGLYQYRVNGENLLTQVYGNTSYNFASLNIVASPGLGSTNVTATVNTPSSGALNFSYNGDLFMNGVSVNHSFRSNNQIKPMSQFAQDKQDMIEYINGYKK